MLATLDQLRSNPHCMQAIRQGGAYDIALAEEQLAHSGERFSYTDTAFHIDPMQEEDPERDYCDLKRMPHTVNHWGQLKLLLTELDFLTPYLHVPELCVVYVGSSPGHHLKPLVDLMPQTWTWELWDPKPNEVFGDWRTPVIEKQVRVQDFVWEEGSEQLMAKQADLVRRRKFMEEHVKNLQRIDTAQSHVELNRKHLEELRHTMVIQREHRPNVKVHSSELDYRQAVRLRSHYVTRPYSDQDPQLLLISDIRTNTSEHAVHADMEAQRSTCEALRPYQASLKFKLPYSDSFPALYPYLDGDLRLQPFSPRISHECRLHTLKGEELLEEKLYDHEEYARRMYRFQTVWRTSIYGDALACDLTHRPALASYRVGTDNCYDCTAAKLIIQRYAEMAGVLDGLSVLDDLVQKLAQVQAACKADGSLGDE